MSESEDGTDIFEITDFTTASEFERFVAQLEEVIHEWKLTTNSRYSYTKDLDINTAKWQELTDEITFANFPFGITFYCIKGEDSQSTSENMNTPTLQISSELSSSKEGLWAPALKELHHNKQEFPSKVHCLCRWYGLASFVVIYPKSYSISDESRINMLVSAITVASQTTSCVVPLFVQSLEPSRKFYTGCLWSPNSTTSFQMVHLNRVPEKFKNLCGLLDVFKQKLNMQRDIQTKAVVSVRLTCVLQDLERNVWSWPHEQAGFLEDGAKSTVLSLTGANCLPFGTYEDSIENLCLYAMWLNMSEDVLSDNSANSDLEPLSAPIWTTQVTMSKEVQGLLTQCLLKFANLCDSKESFGQAVGTKDEKNDNELADALEKLTDPHTQYNLPSLSRVSRVVSNTRSRLSSHPQTDSPIPLDLLNKILLHVFPDASGEQGEVDEILSEETEGLKEVFKFYKTAPVHSPLYNLAVACCLVNHSYGGLKAVAHLWHEFVLEMRYRLDNSILLPGLEKGLPNLSQGILYQKLQMLNCCIETKISRDQNVSTLHESSTDHTTDKPETSAEGEGVISHEIESVECTEADEAADEDDNEEFFDCEADSIEDNSPAPTASSDGGIALQPQGRLCLLGEQKLMNSDEFIYVPLTQEPSPMTEDMLEEHADMLTRLGTSSSGSSLRARLQSASLVSDMESFKAANPGCVLEDFVRWYSPRDFIEESVIEKDTGNTVEKGCLSKRMLVPGNMWQEAWSNAKPIPAKRQKRLFNDTKEAEKVLHLLANLTPAQVALHLLPMACQSAIGQIKKQGEDLVPSLAPSIKTLISQLERVTRNSSQSAGAYIDCVHSMHSAELVISRAKSLFLKFGCDEVSEDSEDVREFVLSLLTQEEVKVVGGARGPIGKALRNLFQKHMQSGHQNPYSSSKDKSDMGSAVFPKPVAKEYILRTVAPRPTPYSQQLPQYMRCVMNGYEYRLCGAFSEDSTFV